MGETLKTPLFEKKPELDPSRKVELAPIDRFGDLKRILLTEGDKPLKPTDIAGMEEAFAEVLKARDFSFEVFTPEQSGGGPNYKVQRENLVKVVGEATVTELEEWGGELFEAAGRKTHDKSTGKRGIVVAQVVLDLYRFSAKLRTQDRENNNDHQRVVETVEKLNDRIRNWNIGGAKNPSPCSGEIMARVIDWMLTGVMSVPEADAK